ncbi:MAG TPA: DUF3892 domain-containing protein [Bacillales bacterium]|nr:DUF3892 domain-containing protein [Bacillales bacterium]
MVPKKEIVAVRKNGDGDIQEVQFNDGSTASVAQAIQMAEEDLIANVNTGATRGENSHKTLRSDPDGDPTNNLDNLPGF